MKLVIRNVEFFLFNNELWYKNLETGVNEKFTESSTDMASFVIDEMYEFWADAYKALDKEYKSLDFNTQFKRFRIARRFISCNCGNIDDIKDIDESGKFHFEHVPCPLRGECQLENIVCHPKFNSKISDSEKRVLELLYKGEEKSYIADKLCLSEHTVNNHIRNAYRRIGVRSTADFVKYASTNHIFK